MKTGQRVVCVVPGEWETVQGPDKGTNDPVKGQIYTVKELHDTSIGLCIELYEITKRTAYNAKYFIPLDENWTEEVIANVLKKQLTKPELQTI